LTNNSQQVTAVWQKWRFSASYDSFVVKQTFVLRMNICGENRHLRQAANRYSALDNSNISENFVTLFYLTIAAIVIASLIIYFRQRKILNEKINDLTKKLKDSTTENSKLQKANSELKECISNKDRLYEAYKKSDIFYISSMYSDFLTLEYSLSEKWLDNKEIIIKHNPNFYERVKVGREAKKAAETVRELKKETRLFIEQNKIMLYKYESLLSLFPELKDYVDDIDTIKELSNFKDIENLKEEYDRVADYISKDEYQRMSVDARNQLALNNYIKGKKSKWQIGRDYEMYCAYIYEKDGWVVQRYGIEKQLNDMGRDIIATKNGSVHIIQCKFWSNDKLIHEKHIAQLYGSTIEYSIANDTTSSQSKIFPVFITNIELSETAKKFAKRLNVIICKWQLQDFPRIKCNINNGEKIYHLPFDQQYDRTLIKNVGEFYAFTVNEAVKKEFKRAKKHFFTS